jgi:hypothetical protein
LTRGLPASTLPSVNPFLILFAAMALIGVGIYFSWKAEQKRRAKFASFAAAKGWSFTPVDTYGLVDRWGGHPFGRGESRKVSNVFTGRTNDGRDLVAFDYKYEESSTDSKGNSSTTTYRFGVCVIRIPCAMPGLHVGKENLFTRIGSFVGMTDIEFESDDFNRAFLVKCEDAKFASDVLHPRTMELLLQHGRDVEWRFENCDMLSWRSGRLDIPDLLRRVDLMCRVVEGIPAFVWKDRGYDPGAAAHSQEGR